MTYYQSKAEQFTDYYKQLKDTFKFESNLSLMYCAMMYINNKTQPDLQYLKDARDYLRAQTSIFSNFRGINELIVAVMIALNGNYQRCFDEAKQCYEELIDEGFKSGTYLPVAAIYIARNSEPTERTQTIKRMQLIYKDMKANHFWLTSQDDYIYAALLATSKRSVEDITKISECYYNTLHQQGLSKNDALQSLSHVLTLSDEDTTTLAERFINFKQLLKTRGYNIKSYTIPVVGVMTLVDKQSEKMADAAVQLADWLKQQRSFGNWSIDKNMRLALSAALITDYHIDDYQKSVEENILATTIQSLMIAQNISMMTAVFSVSASTAGSH